MCGSSTVKNQNRNAPTHEGEVVNVSRNSEGYAMRLTDLNIVPESTNNERGEFTLYNLGPKLPGTRKVIINLPAYIVNSHTFSNDCNYDVSSQYNLLLRSPENKDLFVSEHHELLQIMSQYVYYRKLCLWIRDELQKKRAELLAAARNALIDARDNECRCTVEKECDNVPRKILSKEGAEFLKSMARKESECNFFQQKKDKIDDPVCEKCQNKFKTNENENNKTKVCKKKKSEINIDKCDKVRLAGNGSSDKIKTTQKNKDKKKSGTDNERKRGGGIDEEEIIAKTDKESKWHARQTTKQNEDHEAQVKKKRNLLKNVSCTIL